MSNQLETETFAQLPLGAIEPDPEQHRREVSEAALRTLADSIEQVGLRNPIEVYPVVFDEGGVPTKYRILCGECRYRACKRLGFERVSCKIVPAPTPLQRERVMRAENAAREDLSILDDAYSLHRVVEAELAADPKAKRVPVMKIVAAREGLSLSELYARVGLVEAPECLRKELRASGGDRFSRAQAYSLMRKWGEVEESVLKPKRAEEAANEFAALKRFAKTMTMGQAEQRSVEDVFAEVVPVYAAERRLDPRKVHANLEWYRDVMRRAEERFAVIVRCAGAAGVSGAEIKARSARALEKPRAPKKASAKTLAQLKLAPAPAAEPVVAKAPPKKRAPRPVVLHSGRPGGKGPITVHTDRIAHPRATVEARAALRELLVGLVAKIDEVQPPAAV